MNKKLMVLAVAGTISFILGGINPTTLYGTQYLTSNPGYSYAIAPWWNDSWSYRKPITINSSQVDSDLTNFPILVNITDTDLRDDAQVDGDDITFILYYGSTIQLNHEIELFNGTTGELVAWVNVTTLNSSSDTVIYMYYGNSSCSSQENIVGVWDSNYVGVWHLNESGNGTADEFKDSTSYTNHGQGGGGTASQIPTQTDAKIYKGQNFDGGNDYVDCGSDANLTSDLDTFTVTAWVKSPGGYDYEPLIGWTATVHPALYYEMHASTDSLLWMASSNYRYFSYTPVDIVDDNWHHIAFVMPGSAQSDITNAKLYADGQVQTAGSTIASEAQKSKTNFFIAKSAGSYYGKGIFDEVRVSNIIRNASWINTSYNTMNSPSTFLSVGSEGTQS